MARCRVVLPDTIRVPLSDGDFLTVKKELNAGEYMDLVAEGAAGKPFAVLVAYLVSWTLLGVNEAPLTYSVAFTPDERRDVLRLLDVATLVELSAAITAHVDANERAIQEKKRIPDLAVAS